MLWKWNILDADGNIVETKQKLVSCTTWDDVTVTTLGLQVDINAGGEQAVCADSAVLGATNPSPMNSANYSLPTLTDADGNVISSNPKTWWYVVHGAGTFGKLDDDGNWVDNSTDPNVIVKNMSYDQNIYRWNAEFTVDVLNNTSEQNVQTLTCTSTDDAYVEADMFIIFNHHMQILEKIEKNATKIQ